MAGGPGLGWELESLDIADEERIPLQQYSRKYREAEGAPGAGWAPGSWG
jgi:hypothetical protein